MTSSERQLTLVPMGGLCNRMNTILAGIEWQKHNPDTSLHILWWNSHGCRATFDDLFMPIDTAGRDISLQSMNSLLKDRPATLRNLHVPGFFRKCFYDIALDDHSHDCSQFDALVAGKSSIYVASSNTFCQYTVREHIGRVFKPAADLQQRIGFYPPHKIHNTL